MYLFLSGFIAALILSSVVFAYFYRRQASGKDRELGNRTGELVELSKLTGGLAHEIKNPLSTIKVNLRVAEEDLSDHQEVAGCGRALRKIQVVKKEADRLGQILESFLRYIDRSELQVERHDVNRVVGEVVDFYSPQAESEGIRVRCGVSGEPLVSEIDSGLFKQVLLNLFLNSQQAMPEGGELIIKTRRGKGAAVIEVSDTGSGIEKDKLESIFDAYYTTKRCGSGLGLPMARKVVKMHGGRISVASEPGKGTSFTIELPLSKGSDLSDEQ